MSANAYSSLALNEATPSLQVNQFIALCNSLYAELRVRVEGEISGYSISRGAFVFFDLKDEKEECRVSCFVMLHQVTTQLEDGMRVVVEGKPSIYVKSGQFRLMASRIEPIGQGSVKRAFDLLSAKLKSEGLFDENRKRALPRYPERVGIISSSEAAGFGDFKKIALGRLPGVSYTLINVAVQGRDAEAEICAAFDYLNSHFQLDAIALLRGGGSIEDLHAFNSEPVARAIVRSKAPVIVGVGHERDVTIADYCADVRAATPSNAAQLLVPSKEDVVIYSARLTLEGRRRVERAIQIVRERVSRLTTRGHDQLLFQIRTLRNQVEHRMKTIEALSPQRTLERGYSITCTEEGTRITSKRQVGSGAILTTRLVDGMLYSISK